MSIYSKFSFLQISFHKTSILYQKQNKNQSQSILPLKFPCNVYLFQGYFGTLTLDLNTHAHTYSSRHFSELHLLPTLVSPNGVGICKSSIRCRQSLCVQHWHIPNSFFSVKKKMFSNSDHTSTSSLRTV